MALLHLFFLGPLTLQTQGQPLPLPATQKAQSLLAYLVMHRSTPHPRLQLAGQFWPNLTDARARRSLNTALWQIRKVLPAADYILADPYNVQFNSAGDYWLDVVEFEALSTPTSSDQPADESTEYVGRLSQAVAIYRGEFLEGLYDAWVLEERYRLEARFLDTLSRLALTHQHRGAHQDALVCAQRLLQHDPLREDIHRLVIRLQLTLGDTVAAVRQCNYCRALLRGELGIDPSPETMALCQPLFHHPWPTEDTADTIDLRLPANTAPGWSTLQRPPLIGRDDELQHLLSAWQATISGQGQVILISGEAGVGKTRLVAELAQSAGWRDGITLWGSCYEYERALPYQPLVEALRSGWPFMPVPALDALPLWMLAEVAQLVPELRQQYPKLPPPAFLDLHMAQTRLTALVGFLTAVATRMPLLLVLEDLHWAGESTLAFFHHLARHLVVGMRVLLVGTYRHTEVTADHVLHDTARWLGRESQVMEIHLDGLTPGAVESLVDALLGLGDQGAALASLSTPDLSLYTPRRAGWSDRAVRLAQQLYQATDGNPFFLLEMLRILIESGALETRRVDTKGDTIPLPVPDSVRALILARAARLDAAARDLLNVAAVAGREFDLDLLELAWGKGEQATLQALDDLLRHHLLRENPGQHDYAFDHDLTREVIYQALHHHRRRHLHRRVGQALQQLTSHLSNPPLAELAHHFYHGQGRDPTLAVSYGLRAGDEALARYALREALRWYRQSRALLDHVGLTPANDGALAEMYIYLCLGEGRTLRLLGEYGAAAIVLREGLPWACIQDDQSAQADLLYALGRVAHEVGDFAGAKDCFRQAASHYQTLDDHAGLAETLHRLARTAYDAGDDPAETEALSQQVLALSQEIGNVNLQGLARWALGRIHYRRAEFSAAEACYSKALECFRQVGNREDEGWTHLLWGLVYGLRYQLHEAAAHFASSEAIFRDLEQPWGIGASLTQRGMAYLRRGELDEAEALWQEALHIFRDVNSPWEQAAVLWRLGLAAHRRAALDPSGLSPAGRSLALAHLAEGEALARRIGHRELCLLIHLTQGDVHAAAGAWSAAEAAYSEALALGQATDDHRFLPRICCGLAEVALGRGDAPQALAWVTKGRVLAATEDIEAQGMLWRVEGQALATQDQIAAARAALERSIALLSGPPVPFELVRSQRALMHIEMHPEA